MPTQLPSFQTGRVILLFGTDDYLEVADNALLNIGEGVSLTAIIVLKRFGNASAQQYVVSKQFDTSGTSPGYQIRISSGGKTPLIVVGDNLSIRSTSPSAVNDGQLSLISLIRETPNLKSSLNTTISTPISDGTKSLKNSLSFFLGRRAGAATEFAEMEFVCAAVFRRALIQDEINKLYQQLVLENFYV